MGWGFVLADKNSSGLCVFKQRSVLKKQRTTDFGAVMYGCVDFLLRECRIMASGKHSLAIGI